MKYIAAEVTGYVLMTRDIEVEIDESELEKVLEEITDAQTEEDFKHWLQRPDDEIWVDLDTLAENFGVGESKLSKRANAIAEEWENLPDAIKVRDFNFEYDEDSDPHINACREWLLSKGWRYNEDKDIFYRKK